MLIVGNCFVITSNYHKLSLPVFMVIIVTSHEVMYSVNYVELSITKLQCCVVGNFAAFHTNCYELTEILTVTYYDLSVIANNYATIPFEFRTLLRGSPERAKLNL